MDLPIVIDVHEETPIVSGDIKKITCHSPLIPGTNVPSNYLSCIIVHKDGSIEYYIKEKKSD